MGVVVPAPTPRNGLRHVCSIAEGGMGVVEVAAREDGRFRRLYAVKRLRESLRDEDELKAMFIEEARLAGLLRHANVVSVIDVGHDERGPYLVMDYIEGVSASALVGRLSARGMCMPLQVALEIATHAARGLHAAHELRDPEGRPLHLVHRDVSPQNILIGHDGTARVADFGIAKATGRTTRTQTGVVKGKLGYMAPEQLRYEEPDRRSDVFALGVVLYELLSGRRLYKSCEGSDGPRRILNEPPPDLGEEREDAPAALVELLFGMLAKSPSHRPATAEEVAERIDAIRHDVLRLEDKIELAAFLEETFGEDREAERSRVQRALAEMATPRPTEPGSSTEADEPSTVADAIRPASRRRGVAIALLAAGLLVAVGLGLGLGRLTPAAPEPARSASQPDRLAATPPAIEAPLAHLPPDTPATAGQTHESEPTPRDSRP